MLGDGSTAVPSKVLGRSLIGLAALRVQHRYRYEEDDMGNEDKIANKGESMLGKAKESLGDATDNKDLQAEGKSDQSKADLKDAGEKVKDAFKK
jgi:uncharacterized protein YjbJ (UPF0337 family)